jgi:hypothetical protein
MIIGFISLSGKRSLSMSEMAPCEKCWSEVCDHLRNDSIVIGLLARKIRNMSEDDFTKEFSEEQIQRVAKIEKLLEEKWKGVTAFRFDESWRRKDIGRCNSTASLMSKIGSVPRIMEKLKAFCAQSR